MDHALAALADRQHRVASAAQIVPLGISRRAIAHRVSAGRLHVILPGVYAIGHRAIGRKGWWMAAVLACGEGSRLGYRSAAALWGLRPTSSSRIDVVTPSTRCRAPAGIDLHRTRSLPDGHCAEVDGIPVTSVARTLVDLGAVVPSQALARAVHEAEVLRLLDVNAVVEAIGDGRGRRGAAALRRIIGVPDAGVRREGLEQRFHALCRRAGLPAPRCNDHIWGGDRLYEVDAWWPDHGLAVELDDTRTHLTRRAFESDRRRDAALLRQGVTTLRVTWRRMTTEEPALVEDLRALLGVLRAEANDIRPDQLTERERARS